MMVYAETKECGKSFIQSLGKPPQVPQNGGRTTLLSSFYSLTPAPSPNGEGSE